MIKDQYYSLIEFNLRGTCTLFQLYSIISLNQGSVLSSYLNGFTLSQGDMEFIYVNFTILFLTQAVVDQCASKYYYWMNKIKIQKYNSGIYRLYDTRYIHDTHTRYEWIYEVMTICHDEL